MALDVNKIIMESVQEQLNSNNESRTEKQSDKTIMTESAEHINEEESYNPIAAAIPPAISAGLGALTLRNKLRSVK